MSRAEFGRTSCVSWRSPADMHKSHHDRCKVATNLAMSHSVLSSILRSLRQRKVLLTGVDFSAQGVKVGWDITRTVGITKYSKVRNIRCNNQNVLLRSRHLPVDMPSASHVLCGFKDLCSNAELLFKLYSSLDTSKTDDMMICPYYEYE